MARYCGEKNPMVLLENAKQFQQRCLVDGKSLFTDLQVWTTQYCDELHHCFIDNPDASDADFFTKLEGQLKSGSAEMKVLAAEMLWLMFVCPSKTYPATKRQSIERVFSWSGHQISTDARQQYLSDEALTGVGSSGTAYNTLRWRELNYCIRMASEFLKLTAPDRIALLADHVNFASWLETIPENNSRQLRHMLLFLFFPDFHERIFGNTDREAILLSLGGLSKKQYNQLTCAQADNELLKLRKKFETEFGTTELDYYVEPLKDKWATSKPATQVAMNTVNEASTTYKAQQNQTQNVSLNRILYGPPGTGKTYNTIFEALAIVDPLFLANHRNNYEKIKERFDELIDKNKIGFVTFHQSFSYEDFVEGVKANTTTTDQVTYDIEEGIFKRMCVVGQSRAGILQTSTNSNLDIAGRKVWKMSLGDTQGDDAFVFQQCVDNGYVLLGYGYDIDFTGANDRLSVTDFYKRKGVV